jgi:hypothetical protein
VGGKRRSGTGGDGGISCLPGRVPNLYLDTLSVQSTVLILKSMSMVVMKEGVKESLRRIWSRQLFPRLVE